MHRFSRHYVLFSLFCASVCFLFPFGRCLPALAATRALAVIQTMPEGTVPDLAQITVRFGDAMRPLGAADEARETSPLRLSTRKGKLPPGNFRWLDPYTLAYIFTEPVPFPVSIRASVPKGTASIAGAVLDRDVSWETATPPLALRLTNGQDNPLSQKNAVLRLESNYPLNITQLRKKSRLALNGKPLAFTLSEPERYTFRQGRPGVWVFEYRIKGDLPKNSTVTLGIAGGLTAAGGGEPAGKASFSLPTYGGLDLTRWDIGGYPDKTGKRPRPEHRLFLSFNNTVRLGDLLDRVTVTPEPALPDPEEIRRESSGSSHSLPYIWKPRTEYTVTLEPGLRDAYGTTLTKRRVITFTTGDHMPFLSMPGGRTVMERDTARRFPLTMRNAGTVTARFRHIPWEPEAFRLLKEDGGMNSETFLKIPGARETTLILDTTGKPNATLRKRLDIPAALGFDAADVQGLMSVTLLPPDRNAAVSEDVAALYSNRTHTAALQATDLGISVRLGDGGGLAWITGLSSGEPVPGAAVSLLDKGGKQIWKGTTDDEGLAALPGLASLPDMPRFCFAATGADAAALDLASGSLPEDMKDYAQRKKDSIPWAIHAVTQLPLYQPGQTVNALVYARRHGNVLNGAKQNFPAWRPVSGETLSLAVVDRNGKEIHTLTGKTNAYGSIPLSFTLGRDAEPGWYSVRAKFDDSGREAAVAAFQTASFRPPEFTVDLTPPAAQPVPLTGSFTVGVKAGYFSGATLAEGDIGMRVETAETRFAPPRLSGYNTGPEFDPYRRHVNNADDTATVAGRLDATGAAILHVPWRARPELPQNVFFTATVTDPSNLTSQGTASVLFHPSEYYIGLRAPFFATRGKPVDLMLKAATWDDKPLADLPVTLKAERLDYENGELTETLVWEKQLRLRDETGDRVTASFDRSGSYRLTAGVVDSSGRRNTAAAIVHVPGPDMFRAAGYRNQRLELLAEEKTYQPGDTAKIVLKTPFDKAVALVSIERNGVRRTSVHPVTGRDPVIDIPIQEADAPYIHAAITLVKGRTAPLPEAGTSGPDEGAPVFLQAGVTLRVAGTESGLSVSVTTDAEEYRPGATVKASAEVTDFSGKGRKAQVTILAVDERVLRAAGERTNYDPLRTFTSRYPNRMHSADIWRYLLTGFPGPDEDHMTMRMNAFSAPKQALEMALSAGPDSGAPDIALRLDFTPMVFWLAQGETDANGGLDVSFTLPDTPTSYRIVAVAADRDRGFGTGQTSVRASKPLQLLPVLPKFVTEGDRIDAGVLVQNTGKTPGRAVITASFSGARSEGPDTPRSIALEAGQSVLVSFPLRANMLTAPSGELRIRVTARMGDETDGAEFALPVKPARPLTTVAAAGMLGEKEHLDLPVAAPAGLDPRSGMEVVFAASPAAGIPLAASQVIRYPWNCLEQRLSRAWARMIRLEHGDLVGLAPDTGDRDAIAEELAVIPTFQNENGSFGFWPGFRDDNAGGSSLFLTAYALHVSMEGGRLGLALPESVTGKAANFLAETLRAFAAGEPNPPASPDALAFALYALARHDRESAARFFPGILAHCAAGETNPLGWSSLLLALDSLPGTADREAAIALILSAMEKTAAVTPAHLHFGSAYDTGHWRTLGSGLRDNAAALAALAAVKPDYPRLEALGAWVGQRLGDTKILTTQEGVFGIWGLARYLAYLGGDRETAVRAVWNGKDEAFASFSKLVSPPTSWVLPASALNGGNDSTLTLAAVSGRPYWTVRLAFASPGLPVKEENAGLVITRTLSSKGPWKVGDTVEVTLAVTVPATRRHVLLADPFPAGFEPLYASRVDLAAREKGSSWNSPWLWRDALDDAMLLYAPVLHPGTHTYTHTLRAVASGEFTQRPSFVEEMYAPEVFGRTPGGVVEVTGKEKTPPRK